jgi:hypothetical protein
MEVYGGIPANGSSMSNGSTSGNTTNTGGGNQFMPNKYQFATYYGQKSMMNNGGAGSHFGQGGNQGGNNQYEYSIDGPNAMGSGVIASGGTRLISSELNSYQSEKKIGGNGSNEHHYNSGGRSNNP